MAKQGHPSLTDSQPDRLQLNSQNVKQPPALGLRRARRPDARMHGKAQGLSGAVMPCCRLQTPFFSFGAAVKPGTFCADLPPRRLPTCLIQTVGCCYAGPKKQQSGDGGNYQASHEQACMSVCRVGSASRLCTAPALDRLSSMRKMRTRQIVSCFNSNKF